MDQTTRRLHLSLLRHLRGVSQEWEKWLKEQPDTPGENRLRGLPVVLFMLQALISTWDAWIKVQEYGIRPRK